MQRRALISILACAPLVEVDEAWGNSQNLVVLVNSATNVDQVSEDELSRIFRMKTKTWPNGTPIQPFNMPAKHPLREAFDLAILHMDPGQVARYWIDQKVRGGSHPPKPVPSERVMVALIERLAGAVGYAPADLVQGNVKIVARVRTGSAVNM